MTSPERSWPSPDKLVSTLLTTNKRTMRSERDSGDCRPGSVWSGPVAEEERSHDWKTRNLARKQHRTRGVGYRNVMVLGG